MTPSLSVVIPTLGRASLSQTLDSLDAQPEAEQVEVIVVADIFGGLTADLEQARAHVQDERDADRYVWLEVDGGRHCWGHPQRTYGARAANAPWIWFTQDDNISAAGAFAAMQAAIDAQDHPRPLFFRWLAPWRQLIWRDEHLMLGNIDADCLVFPRPLAEQIEWGLRYEGDFDAAVRAAELAAGDIDWRPDLISIARPWPADLWWKVAA